MTNVPSLTGTKNKHQTKNAKLNSSDRATSLGYCVCFPLHDTLVLIPHQHFSETKGKIKLPPFLIFFFFSIILNLKHPDIFFFFFFCTMLSRKRGVCKGQGIHPGPECTTFGSAPGYLPLPNIDQTVTCCRDEPCEIPIKRVCIRKWASHSET